MAAMTNESSWLHVANHASDKSSGYWGDAAGGVTHAFCEPHYAVSHYVAEFYNSISSFIFVACAGYLLVRNKLPNDAFSQLAAAWLCIIGIGSALFHGIMRFEFQLMDEIPMVGLMLTVSLAKLRAKRLCLTQQQLLILSSLLAAGCVALICVYVIWGVYEIFIHGFSLVCLADSALAWFIVRKSKHGTRKTQIERNALLAALVAILVGRTLWESENRLCNKYPQVWLLHPLWHLFSCISAYNNILFTYVTQVDSNNQVAIEWIGFPLPGEAKKKSA